MTTRSIRRQDPLLQGSFPLLLFLLFAVFSAFLEMLPLVRHLKLIFITATLGLIVVFVTGQFQKVMSTRVGQAVAAFTIWFIACVPFGLWPGGSFRVFSEQMYKAALIFLITAGLLTTLSQARRIFHAMAYGVGMMAIATVILNQRTAGRLMLDNTRFANANDLAWTLIVGLTFLGYLYIRGNRTQKVIAVILLVPVLVALSRTGSREGMLGAVMLILIVFKESSKATRAKMVAALPVLLIAVVAVIPAEIRMRYVTWFGEVSFQEAYGRGRGSWIGSSEARKQLLIDSLIVTAKHPLLGVGPGNFPVAQDELAQARGERSLWHVTHNTYTEASSEMGIPGLVIFLTFLYQTFKILKSIIRTRSRSPEWVELRLMALTLRSVLAVFLVVAFFSSLTYNIDVQILAGLAVALGFIAQKQRAIDRAAAGEGVVKSSAEATLEPVPVG